jgi:hypothetical protein
VRLLTRKGTRVRAGVLPAPVAFLRAPPVGKALGYARVVALATVACLLAAGCSPGADSPPYPSIFPTAHDGPPPRTDTPMNAVEVQKATEDLIGERDRLNAQAPSQGQSTGQATASGTTSGTTGAKTAAMTKTKKKAAKTAPQQTAAMPLATTAGAQGAGMQAAGSDPKP